MLESNTGNVDRQMVVN